MKPWKVSATPPYNAPGDFLFNISRKLIPNYCWFLFGAFGLLLARLAGPVDLRIPLLTGIALLGLWRHYLGPFNGNSVTRSTRSLPPLPCTRLTRCSRGLSKFSSGTCPAAGNGARQDPSTLVGAQLAR